MESNFLRQVENSIRFYLKSENENLSGGEKFVLIITIRLLKEKQVISKQDICNENKVKNSTTYSIIKSLENKGYLTSKRGNQFYSKSFLSLINKGLMFSNNFKTKILCEI